MTWHFLEVWGLLLVSFAIGGVLGTLLYVVLAASPLAEAQLDVADAVYDQFAAIGAFFGRWRTPVAAYGLDRDLPDYVRPIPAPLPLHDDHDYPHGAEADGSLSYADADRAGPPPEPVEWVEEVAEALGVAEHEPEPPALDDGAWEEDDLAWREGDPEWDDEEPWDDGEIEPEDVEATTVAEAGAPFAEPYDLPHAETEEPLEPAASEPVALAEAEAESLEPELDELAVAGETEAEPPADELAEPVAEALHPAEGEDAGEAPAYEAQPYDTQPYEEATEGEPDVGEPAEDEARADAPGDLPPAEPEATAEPEAAAGPSAEPTSGPAVAAADPVEPLSETTPAPGPEIPPPADAVAASAHAPEAAPDSVPEVEPAPGDEPVPEPEEMQGIDAPPAETPEAIVAEAEPAAAGPQEDAALPEPVAPPVPPPVAPPPPARTRHVDPDLPAMRPLTLSAPRNGVPDNLQKIRGIGRKNEELLNSLGIFHFGQIAAWTPAEARWVASHLSFPERIERDDWIGQAIVFATGGDTGIAKVTRPDDGGDAESSVAA